MKQNTNHHLQSFFHLPSQPKDFNDSQPLNKKPFTIFLRQKREQRTSTQKSQTALWTNQQKQRYSVFICYFRQILSQSSSDYNEWNMFKAMSKYIKSRSPQQCRSYHIKLLKQFHTISKFIEIVVKRLPSLREKIISSENQLNMLQFQFNLFIHQQVLLQEKPSNFPNYSLSEKQQFKPLPKTSDTYVQEPNSVGQYYQNYSFNHLGAFNNKSSFNSSQNNLNQKLSFKGSIPSFAQNKNSLPSFAEQEEPEQNQGFHKSQEKEYKNQSLNFQWKKPTNSWLDQRQEKDKNQFNVFPQMKNLFKQSGDINETLKEKNEFSSLGFDQSSNGMQKMKEILQCHYLFQLWTSKLERIMRE